LVEAFKSTLEEVARADLILHVADASVPDVQEQIDAVREVLGEIGAGAVPEVLALNKWDRADRPTQSRVRARYTDGIPVSALRGTGVEELAVAIADALAAGTFVISMVIPHGRSDVVARLHREADVLSSSAGEDGMHLEVRVGERLRRELDPFVEPRRGRVRA
jgi:GTP-binding protein HflX